MTSMRWIFVLLALAACAALIWFVGPAVAIAGHAVLESDARRLAVIASLLALATLTLVWRAASARHADRRLVDGIAQAPAPQPMDGTMQRSFEEGDVLRTRFREALGILRRTSGGGGKRLRELPWYVLIGPPGAGKTAALRHAGLRFPLADRFGDEALRGVGGTRDCDWWFTDDAVLLDTAGRYVTQDSDEPVDGSAWSAFLALLRRHRKRRPINGIIVAISLADILDPDAERRARHARSIRQRIQELDASLHLRFPVYLVLTKADLVAGFGEFFEPLEPAQREQVWGLTFGPAEQDAPAAFRPAFEALVARLNDRMLTRLSEEQDATRRALVFGFPRGVAMLKQHIGAFIDDAFAATRYDLQPWLRGVYLTSATQEGTPIDPAAGQIARSFGLGAVPTTAAARRVGRSYFLGGLLKHVIFPEAELVGSNRSAERRRAWLHAAAYALVVCGVLGATALWMAGYARNQAAIAHLSERVDAFAASESRHGADGASLDDLLQRLDALRALALEKEPGSSWWLDAAMALHQARRLGAAADRAYVRELGRQLAPRVAVGLADTVRGAGNDSDAAYAALKGYLMLAQPEHRDAAYLAALTQLAWTRAWPDEPGKVTRMQAHVDALLAGGLAPIALDEDLVRDTRATLSRLPLADLVYGRIRREALQGHGQPFRLRDALGSAGAAAFERRNGQDPGPDVPAFYTPEGYRSEFLPQSLGLTKTLRGETWVMGNRRDDPGAVELATLADDIGRRYAADYIQAWQGLLGNLAPATPESPTQAQAVLAQLTGPNSALRALLVAVDRNTTLGSPAGHAAADHAGQRLEQAQGELRSLLQHAGGPAARNDPLPSPAEAVHGAFAELDAVVQADKDGRAPIDGVVERLGRLYAELDGSVAQADADPARPPDSPAARGVKEIALAQPEPLKGWLLLLADSAVRVGDRQRQAALQKKRGDEQKSLRDKINAAWQSDVLPFCTAAVANRYPADRHAALDATPKDFGRLFAPGGLIDAFVKDNLKPYIDMSRRPWRWRSANDVDLAARPESLHPLELAAIWRDAYFRDGAAVPSIELSVRPLASDAMGARSALTLGEQQRIALAATGHLQVVRWPAPDGAQQASIAIGDARGDDVRSADGPWAWMRLLDQAALDRVTPDRLVATFRMASGTALIELRAASVINPLQPEAAQRFECPKGF